MSESALALEWWGRCDEERERAVGGDEKAVGAVATHNRTTSRGDPQSRSLQSRADIRSITVSTVLKIPVLVCRKPVATRVIDNNSLSSITGQRILHCD